MKKSLIFLLSIFTLLVFVSCGSKPEEETAEPEAPVVEETTNEKEGALSEHEQLIADIDEARNKAIEAGAAEKAPKQLKEIDDYYESIKGNKKSLKADGFKVTRLYDFLTDYIRATDAKKEIEDNNFTSYANDLYVVGCDKLAAVEDTFKDLKTLDEVAANNAREASSKFNAVLTIAYRKLAKDERSLAYAEKKNADSVKAAVAQKARYTETAENFKKGDQLLAMQAPKKAIEYYKNSKEGFAALYKEVGEKRATAQKAIDEAKKAVEESANYAVAADESAPITGDVAGIEDEDTVLLEADEYADPEEAEIDIAETFEEAVVEKATEVVEEVITEVEEK